MKYSKYILVCLLTAIVFVFLLDSRLFSWSLFNLYNDIEFSEEGLQKAEAFNPEKDMLYLPSLDGKEFFRSVDDLSVCRRPEVRRFLYIYLTRGREYVKRGLVNAEAHRAVVEKVFNENPDIPKELMYLPLLESAFEPNAVSRSYAVGVWQFMAATGSGVGLRNDGWVDERRDVEKSTRAAIVYLRAMYKMFGSWEFALAAYNGGGGYVTGVRKQYPGVPFWALVERNAFVAETNEYVARYAALLLIANNRELFGIRDELNESLKLAKKRDADVFEVEWPVRLDHLAALSGTPVDDIKALNPELVQHMTPPNVKKYPLRLPPDTAEKLREMDDEILYPVRFTSLRLHRVQSGDYVGKIARQYSTSTAGIIYLNRLAAPYLLRPGMVLMVPLF
jgi:membrane-bound lytic murein transglycosylase D